MVFQATPARSATHKQLRSIGAAFADDCPHVWRQLQAGRGLADPPPCLIQLWGNFAPVSRRLCCFGGARERPLTRFFSFRGFSTRP